MAVERKTFSDETKKQAVEMVNSGKTIKDVAAHFGTSAVTVGKWVGGKKAKKVAVAGGTKRGGDIVGGIQARITELEQEIKALKSALKVLQK